MCPEYFTGGGAGGIILVGLAITPSLELGVYVGDG